jgi:hypothetical protein
LQILAGTPPRVWASLENALGEDRTPIKSCEMP